MFHNSGDARNFLCIAAAGLETALGVHAQASYVAMRPNDLRTIQEVTREFGVTARALRFDEQRGLLAPLRESRHRFYSQGDRRRLALILRLKKFGFSLLQITAMLPPSDEAGLEFTISRDDCRNQIAFLEERLTELTTALSQLRECLENSPKSADWMPNELRS